MAAAVAAAATEEASSVSSMVTPAVVATDAPTTLDVGRSEPKLATAPKPATAAATSGSAVSRQATARPAAVLSSSHDDLPALKAKRPAWIVPSVLAAAVVLGVVGLRQLDHAPTPVPAELAHPHQPSKAKAVAATITPKSDEGDDDDDPSTGSDPTPDPTPPEPDPLKHAAAPSAAAPSLAAAKAVPVATAVPRTAEAAPATPPTDAAGAVHVNVDSDPPGARLFWKGKDVGTTPFVLELQPGEKHAYELGLPGYTTRKVVIDGSKTDITIGLRPDPNAPAGASPRK